MKKMFQRLCAVLLPVLLVASLAGCSNPQITSLSIQANLNGDLDINQQESVMVSVEETNAKTDALQFISSDESVLTFTKGVSDSEEIKGTIHTLSEGSAIIYVQTQDEAVKSNEIKINVQDKAKKAEEERQAALKADAQKIIDRIDGIGDVSLESEGTITSIRSNYNTASDEVKALITNVDVLQNAETTLANKKAEKEAADKKAAEEKQAAEQAAAQQKQQTANTGGSTSTKTETSVTPKGGTVLITRTGSKYHTHKCGNGKYYSSTLSEALARGLTPCQKCYG